jgi:hypothetical protein
MYDEDDDDIDDGPLRISERGVETEAEAELRKAKEQVLFGESSIDTPREAAEYLATREAARRLALAERWSDEERKRYEASPERIADAHNRAAADADTLARKLSSSVGERRERAAKIVREHNGRKIPADQFAEVRVDAAKMLSEDKAARQARKMAKRERRAAAPYVKHEPGPYDAGSPHSWIRDTLLARDASTRELVTGRGNGLSDMSAQAIQQRLQRHGEDVAKALRTGDKYGKRLRKVMHEEVRCEDKARHRQIVSERLAGELRSELRAFGTDGGASAAAGGEGAAFVSPAILLDSIWAPYRSPYAAFKEQCNKSIALPDYGLEVYLPTFTTGASVTGQTDGGAVSETDPVAAFGSSAVTMKAGQIEVSYQFLDRAGPGISGDQVLYEQLKQQLDAEVDKYAINQALTSAQTVTENSAFTVTTASGVGGFLGNLKSAKNKLHDAQGVRLKGTHAFVIGDLADYLSAYADAQGRPIFTPTLDDNQLKLRAEGDALAEGYTGYVLVGLALFQDENLPNLGTTQNTQVIVTRPETILQLEGDPIPYLYPPAVAGSLDAILGLRCYCGTIARFKEGVSTISGSAYKASTFA